MNYYQALYALRKRGVRLYTTYSHGGGNRDHRSWIVYFSCETKKVDLPAHYGVDVQCQTYSGKFDGKRACESEAKRTAVVKVARKLGLMGPEEELE